MSQAFYNENDPKAAAWLRELIAHGHIPPGIVCERSITDLSPTDLHGFTQCHFFAGIGGWSLALRLAGVPDSVPVWTGSCPCQPFSAAGKQKGTQDERHLWPSFARLIDFCRPPTVFGEQVASKDGRLWLAGIFADLEGMGYHRAAADLCAAGVGAPHIRQRLYWVADAASQRGAQHEHQPRQGPRRPTGPCDAAECDRLGRLAHSHVGRRAARNGNGPETPQRESGNRIAEQRSGLGGVGDAEGVGRDACADNHDAAEWNAIAPGIGSSTGRLEYPASDGRQQRRPESDRRSPAGGCSPGGMDVAHDKRRATSPSPSPSPDPQSFWANATLLPCTDGKARRIEPGTFPLAHGLPGRVGLLRGYGNAIVPYLAAEFIQAFYEAREILIA